MIPIKEPWELGVMRTAGRKLAEVVARLREQVAEGMMTRDIDRLTEEGIPLTLAVSLHAPDDDTRSAIIPTGRKYRVADILSAARRYQQKVGRPVNIEYTMLQGVNDSDAQARLLAGLLATDDRAGRVHVNLIPYNWIGPGVSGRIYQRPEMERMARFAEILTERGAIAHFRRTRGDDIEGACGQLRETVAGK